jgi:hypothetical protein
MPVAVDDRTFDLARFEDLLPSAVTITRTSNADFQSRQLIVWIDGARVATLLWGDSVTCELSPGPHRLRVSNTLVWKNVQFSLGPGEQAFFEVINRLGFGSIFLIPLFGLGPLYVSVNRMC